MAYKGIDVRATGDRLVLRASLKDSSGVKVTSGTATLRLFRVESDGSLASYDFADNAFKATALTTATVNLVHRTGNNGTYDTGVWTYALTIVSGFTAGGVYLAQVSHASASPTEQEREFQYGSAEGDMVVTGTLIEASVEDLDADVLDDIADAVTGQLGDVEVTVSSPVADSGDVTVIQGDDYLAADGRSIDWVGETSNQWPDLTGASVIMNVNDGDLVVTGSVVTPTGTQRVRVQPTADETGSLDPGTYPFSVVATLASGSRVTLLTGTLTCTDNEAS